MAETRSIRPRRRGRPAKFAEPSRAVALTLPQRTLEQLGRFDPDRSRAISKAVDLATGVGGDAGSGVRIIEVAPGTGVLVVPPLRSLARLAWLTMIEVAPMQRLLAINPGVAVEKVEIDLRDLVDDAAEQAPDEVEALEAIREHLTRFRRGEKISTAQVLIINTR